MELIRENSVAYVMIVYKAEFGINWLIRKELLKILPTRLLSDLFK